jgi:general secretion pathway protein D
MDPAPGRCRWAAEKERTLRAGTVSRIDLRRLRRVVAAGLLLAWMGGCATGRAIQRGDAAAQADDWDTAVVYYREALGRDPDRIDLKIKLERATQRASAAHMRRARELEADNQMSGAIAAYRQAANIDPSNTQALTRAIELERQLRQAAEAARPPAGVDALRQQAAQTSPIPRLDPRAPVSAMRFPNAAVRDLLRTISEMTGINIQYDQGLEGTLSRPYSIDITEMPLEDVLNQILQANTLTYKILNSRSILVYQDTPTNRQRYEDQYIQTFYISHADPAEINALITQIFTGMQMAVRPYVSASKTSNSLTVKATAPVMGVIDKLIRANDKPQAEVLIEAEILEVDRTFVRQLGLDLSQWALGFTFSPESRPTQLIGVYPATPPPISLESLSGIGRDDFYLSSPTALIRLLESNSTTKTLAKPQMRGRAGQQLGLRLGDQVPIPQTVFNSAAAGGVANIPTTQVTYQSVGVNLIFTPRVTYEDEIILDNLTLEKSGLGPFLDVGGQTFPTIVSRSAQSSIRLRDGESTLIAGLLRDEERRSIESLPGLSRLPVLSSIFGNSDRDIDQTDIIMIITPHIVRSQGLTTEDLRPIYIGTGTNVGGGAPPLISPEALGLPSGQNGPAAPTAPAGPGGLPPQQLAPQPAPPGAPVVTTPGGAGPVTPSGAPGTRTPGVVPIEAVPSGGAGAPAPTGGPRISLTPPSAGPDGSIPIGGGPYVMPIQIAGATDIASVSLTITYNPSVLSAPRVGQGSFMAQSGVAPTFTENVSEANGRIEMAFARPTSQPGASGSGTLGALSFGARAAGSSDVTITGVATTTTGQIVPLQFGSTRVVVR